MVKSREGALPTPTDAELDILRVLWRGESAVAEVHDDVQGCATWRHAPC